MMRKLCLASGLFLAGIVAMAMTYEHAGGQVPGPQPVPAQSVPGGGAISISAPAGEGGASLSTGTVTLSAPSAGFVGAAYGPPSGYGGMAGDWTLHDVKMQTLMQADAEQEGEVQAAVIAYSDPSADSAARAEARTKLASALEAQFTARQQRRELEIQQIEERVKKLRDALDKRASAKDKIIERRLNDLLTDAEGLGWGDASTELGRRGGSPYGYPYGTVARPGVPPTTGPGGGNPYGGRPGAGDPAYPGGAGGGRGEGGGRGASGAPSRESQPAPPTP